jgi:hypothetical protein
MEEVLNNLEQIKDWIDTVSDTSALHTNDEFMKLVVELMDRSLYVLRIGVVSVPSEEAAEKGCSKQRAIIVGHIVRVAKLYEGMLIHISERQLELALIFFRLIFEATVRMRYLMRPRHRRESFRSFLLASYKPEKEMLADLAEKAKNRPLIPIEKRINGRIREILRQDKITLTTLRANKTWNVDGKNIRDLLADLQFPTAYSYIFGTGSHSIHGDWDDIRQYHLDHKGRGYSPRLRYTDPDPRIACAATKICLDALSRYLRWNRSDPDRVLSPMVTRLLALNTALDLAHESTLNAKA